MDETKDGMDGRMNAWVNGWMRGCVGEWMDGWMDGWVDRVPRCLEISILCNMTRQDMT